MRHLYLILDLPVLTVDPQVGTLVTDQVSLFSTRAGPTTVTLSSFLQSESFLRLESWRHWTTDSSTPSLPFLHSSTEGPMTTLDRTPPRYMNLVFAVSSCFSPHLLVYFKTCSTVAHGPSVDLSLIHLSPTVSDHMSLFRPEFIVKTFISHFCLFSSKSLSWASHFFSPIFCRNFLKL